MSKNCKDAQELPTFKIQQIYQEQGVDSMIERFQGVTNLRHSNKCWVEVEGFLHLPDEATQPPQTSYLEESIYRRITRVD